MLTIPLHDQNLEHKRSLESLNSKIIKSKRVVVISGAGISCSCGIPVCVLPFHILSLVFIRIYLYAYRILGHQMVYITWLRKSIIVKL